MAEILAVVPSEGIYETGEISYAFLGRAAVPVDIVDRPYGVLLRRELPHGYCNPFMLNRSKEELAAMPQGDGRRWELQLSYGSGLAASGAAESTEDHEGLAVLLAEVGLEDCSLLVPPADIDPLRTVCDGLGHALTVHAYEGRLGTS